MVDYVDAAMTCGSEMKANASMTVMTSSKAKRLVRPLEKPFEVCKFICVYP